MSKSTLVIEQTSNYPQEQAKLEETKQIEEALDQEFALVEEQQNYYHLAYFSCDRI